MVTESNVLPSSRRAIELPSRPTLLCITLPLPSQSPTPTFELVIRTLWCGTFPSSKTACPIDFSLLYGLPRQNPSASSRVWISDNWQHPRNRRPMRAPLEPNPWPTTRPWGSPSSIVHCSLHPSLGPPAAVSESCRGMISLSHVSRLSNNKQHQKERHFELKTVKLTFLYCVITTSRMGRVLVTRCHPLAARGPDTAPGRPLGPACSSP